MSKKKEDAVQEEQLEQETVEQAQPEAVETQPDQGEQMKEQLAQQEDKYLRLAAEYDNYRKRTAKEKESIWTEVKADTAAAFLPVYDNLERASSAVSCLMARSRLSYTGRNAAAVSAFTSVQMDSFSLAVRLR